MIGSLALFAVLAATPVPAPEAVPAQAAVSDRVWRPGPSNPADLDVPITLKLQDAAVVDVLEKLADLLGVTPVIGPGVGGEVSLDVRNLPVSKALEMIEAAAKVEIKVSARILRVRAKTGSGPAAAAPAGTATATTPQVPTRPLGGALRFWLDGAGSPAVAVQVPAYVGRFDLPGCTGPVTVGALGVSGGRVAAVALSSAGASGARAKARVLGEAAIDGTKLLLPGCDGRMVVEVGDPSPGAAVIEPVRVPSGEPLEVAMSLLEVTDESEETLSAPKIQFREDGGFGVKSGYPAEGPGSYTQVTEIHGVPLETASEGDEVLLAVHAAVTRTPATSNAKPALAARRAESFRLRKGKPLRWTVDSGWDGGRAALVLELTFLGRSEARAK